MARRSSVEAGVSVVVVDVGDGLGASGGRIHGTRYTSRLVSPCSRHGVIAVILLGYAVMILARSDPAHVALSAPLSVASCSLTQKSQ